MTFDEYNTDANYDDDNSSLEKLVEIGLKEGKTSDEIKSSLSPKWQKSKKLGEFDNYVTKYSKPKTETEKVITEAPKNNTVITEAEPETIKQNNNAANRQNEDSLTQEQIEYQNQLRNKQQAWDNMLDSAGRQSEAIRNIDDHMVEQLPTFMFKRYSDGEFGDPKSKDAKLRLAHFMINGLGTALSNMGHKINKDGQMEESDYEKYQRTNLEEGMNNRWRKYKEETQAAIDLAKQRGVADEDLNETIAKISSNNRLQASFNRMNEQQKAYALQVMSEIGDDLGNMNDEKFANTLFGLMMTGQDVDYKEAAAMLIYRFIKDPDKREAALSKLGFSGMGSLGSLGSLGGDVKNLTAGASGNLKNYQTIDGETIDFNIMETKGGKEKLRKLMDDLSQRYYDGKIDEETFRKYYEPLYEESRRHMGTGSRDSNAMIKANNASRLNELEQTFNKLNSDASKGIISIDDYKEQYDNLVANAKKWGANEKMLTSLAKNKKSDEVLKKAIAKAAKKKKK